MNKEFRFLEIIKGRIEKFKENREKERLLEKENVISVITRSWSENEVLSYNCTLMTDSNQWLGGNYTEQGCKSFILRNNYHLFTPEEYQKLEDVIYQEKVMKK